MTPQQQARADQIRAALSHALTARCGCGECPTDDQIRAALALDDEALLELTQ